MYQLGQVLNIEINRKKRYLKHVLRHTKDEYVWSLALASSLENHKQVDCIFLSGYKKKKKGIHVSSENLPLNKTAHIWQKA